MKPTRPTKMLSLTVDTTDADRAEHFLMMLDYHLELEKWHDSRIGVLEAALRRTRGDMREVLPIMTHEYSRRRLEMGIEAATAALTPPETNCAHVPVDSPDVSDKHCVKCGEELGPDGHHKPDPVEPFI